MRKLTAIAAALALMCSCAPKAETVDLFNGKDFEGWNFVVDGNADPSEVFSVEDGEIHITGSPFGYMYTEATYSDFDLDVEWSWFDEPKNSGIFLLIAEPSNPFPNGIECQLKAGSAGDFVLLGGSDLKEYVLPEDGVKPNFPKVPKMEESSEKPVGEWNHAHIEVREGVISVWVNDVLQNRATDPVTSGHIGLQSEGGPVKFRTVRLTCR